MGKKKKKGKEKSIIALRLSNNNAVQLIIHVFLAATPCTRSNMKLVLMLPFSSSWGLLKVILGIY